MKQLLIVLVFFTLSISAKSQTTKKFVFPLSVNDSIKIVSITNGQFAFKNAPNTLFGQTMKIDYKLPINSSGTIDYSIFLSYPQGFSKMDGVLYNSGKFKYSDFGIAVKGKGLEIDLPLTAPNASVVIEVDGVLQNLTPQP